MDERVARVIRREASRLTAAEVELAVCATLGLLVARGWNDDEATTRKLATGIGVQLSRLIRERELIPERRAERFAAALRELATAAGDVVVQVDGRELPLHVYVGEVLTRG